MDIPDDCISQSSGMSEGGLVTAGPVFTAALRCARIRASDSTSLPKSQWGRCTLISMMNTISAGRISCGTARSHTHNAAVGTGWPSGKLVGSNAIAFSAAGGVGWCRAGRRMGRIDNLFAELTGM